MKGILPPEAQALLQATTIKHLDAVVSNEVERVLLKLWQSQKLTEEEQEIEINPTELAALWTITHRRPVRPDAARQMFREERTAPIQPSHQWGDGPGRRRLYRLGDVIGVRLRNTGSKRKKRPEPDQQGEC